MSDLPKVGRIRSWLAASAATILFFSAVTASAAQSIQWRFNLTNSSSSTRITGITAGPAGECYVVGLFSGTLALGGTNLTATPTEGGNSFLAKISRSGALEWVRQISGAYSIPFDVAVDSVGQVFVDGIYDGSPADFGTTKLAAPFGRIYDVFVAKYSPDGALLWARRVGGEGTEVLALHSLALGPEGGCYFSGHTDSTNLCFDSVTLTNDMVMRSTAVFLFRLDARGEVVWVRWCGGPAALDGESIASDPSGNVFMAGHQYRGGSYGWTNVTAPGGRGLVIAKFNPAGEVLWAQAESAASPGASGVGYDVHAMAAEQSGSVVLSGRFQGGAAIRFGDLVATNLSPLDGTYLIRLDGNGAAEWVKTAVTSDFSIYPVYLMNSVSVGSSGVVYLSGGISARRAEFDSLVATNRGGVDGVLVRLNAAGQFDRCVQLAGLGNDFVEASTLDSAGNIFVGVYSTSTNVTFLGQELSFSRKRGLAILKIATEVPPPLGISRSSNHITLRWSSLARGFHVETASGGNTPLRWTRCAPIIRTIGLTNTTTFRRTSDNRYFRLKRAW